MSIDKAAKQIDTVCSRRGFPHTTVSGSHLLNIACTIAIPIYGLAVSGMPSEPAFENSLLLCTQGVTTPRLYSQGKTGCKKKYEFPIQRFLSSPRNPQHSAKALGVAVITIS